MKNKWKKEPKCKCGCKHKKAETIINQTLDDIFGDILALATDGSTVSIKELLEGTSDKKLAESNLKKATELMNKEIAKQMEKVSKGERKILCDSPVKVNDENVKDDSFIKDLDEAFKRYEEDKKTSEINVPNAFRAKDLKAKIVPTVRLINVNKTVSEMLAVIYDKIKKNAKDHSLYIDFGDKEWDKWLEKVRPQTLEKVSDRIANHLDLNGFDVDVDFAIDNKEVFMTLNIEW